MISEGKNLVIDLDGTLCFKKEGQSYLDAEPNLELITKLKEFKEKGYYIIIYTGRNMRTHQGNVGKLNADTLVIIHKWLEKFNIPFDEIHVGKPWNGEGFYIDDNAIRPSEFLKFSEEEIYNELKKEKELNFNS